MLGQGLNFMEILIKETKYYHGKGSDGAMNDQICHVSDYICREADVKQHIQNTVDLLQCIHCIQISIADSGKSYNRPVHGIGVTQPDTRMFKIV